MRNLGLSEKEASTKLIDAIYDEMDVDGSGLLDMGEFKKALKKMQADTTNVDQREGVQRRRATQKRALAQAFRDAMDETADYEKSVAMLAKLRASQDASSKLGELIKSKGIKVSDLVRTWDEDETGAGAGVIDRREFRVHVRKVGLDATDAELDQLFDVLDDDGSEALDPKELPQAFSRLLSASLQHKNEVADKVKVVTRAKKVAEAAQKEAWDAVAASEAAIREEEELAKSLEADKAEKEAKARADKEEAKREEKRRALERQKTSMNPFA